MPSYTPLRVRKVRMLIMVIVLATVMMMADLSSTAFLYVGLVVAALLTFGLAFNYIAPQVKPDHRESIAAAVWFATWSVACTLLGLDSGWIIFGMLFAFSGCMMMMARLELPDDPLSDEMSLSKQHLVAQAQYAVFGMIRR